MKLAFASVPCPHGDRACAGMAHCLVRAAGNGAHCGAQSWKPQQLERVQPAQPFELTGVAA